jgi:hypothetical protein
LSTIVDNSARCWTLTPLLDGRYGVLIQAKRSTLFDTFLSPIGDISALWWLSTNRTTTAKREGCGPTENDPDPPPTDGTVAVYPHSPRSHFSCVIGSIRGIIYACSCCPLPFLLFSLPAYPCCLWSETARIWWSRLSTQWHPVLLAWGVYFGDRKRRLVAVLPCRRSSLARHHS